MADVPAGYHLVRLTAGFNPAVPGVLKNASVVACSAAHLSLSVVDASGTSPEACPECGAKGLSKVPRGGALGGAPAGVISRFDM